jgi:hypothetical protein
MVTELMSLLWNCSDVTCDVMLVVEKETREDIIHVLEEG